MTEIKDFINDPINANIIKTVLVLLVGYVFRGIIIRIVHKSVLDTKKYYRIKRNITYIYFSVVIIFLVGIWTKGSTLTTYLGLASAGLAIALKDLLINVAAWLFIMIKKPFVVGDRIEIQGRAGDVIDQRVFQFTLMEIGEWVHNDQSTGRMIHIPNSAVFTYPLANFTSGFQYIWNEVHVLLTFESNHKKAKELFLKIVEDYSLKDTDELKKELRNASKKYMIYYSVMTPIVYTDVKDSGIMLSLRYLCRPHDKRKTIEQIWEDILEVTRTHDDIQLAYNTIRMVNIGQ
ncbi:MAG: mechanosensitive ion channel family protein [Clostridia bacterium]|nr:mechanosensitive ion channel family protein [Clostridia bacterium]